MATRYFVSFDDKDAANLEAASGDSFFEISGIEFGFENLTGAGPSIKSFDFQLDDGLFSKTTPTNLIDGRTFNLKVFAFRDIGENAPLASKLILSTAHVERFDTRAENGSINQFVSVVSNKIEWETNLFDVSGTAAGSKKLVIDRASDLPPEFTDTAGANAITTVLSEANGGGSLDGLRYYMQFSTGGQGAGRATTVTEIDGFDFELSRQINLDLQTNSQGALEFGTLTVTRSADEASSLFALLEKQQVTGGKVDIFAVGNVSGQGPSPIFDVVATYEFANGTINGAQAIVEDGGLSGINEGKHDVVFNFNTLSVVTTEFKAGKKVGDVPYKAQSAAASAANFTPPPIGTINLEETTGELANLPAVVAGNDSIVYLMGAKAGVSTIIDGRSEISLSNASTIGISSGDLFEILDFEIDLDALTLEVTLPEAGILSGFMKKITTTDYTVEVAAVSTTEDKILTSVVLDGAFIASIDTDYSSIFRENNGVAERVITFALPTDSSTGLPDNSNSEFKLVQTRAVNGGEQNSEFKVTSAGASLTGQGSTDPLLTPIGGTLVLPAGEAVPDQDQQVFMQITAIGNGVDDGQTEWVEIDSFNHELGLSAATNGAVSGGLLSVSRVMDDATAKLMQVMAKGLDVEIHIEIYDEFGSTWVNVTHYKFTDAQISSVSTSGTGGSASEGDFMREDLGIVFGTYEEVFVDRDNVDGAGLPIGDSAGSRVTLNQQSPSVTSVSGLTNEANIDTATGRLTLPSVSNDALTTQSGGGADGLKMFLAVDGVDSGDGEQNVHFDAFDQFFSVNSYEFEGSGTGAFASSGFEVEVSNAQNWVALDKLARDAQVAGGPSGEVNVRLIAADHGVEGGVGAGDANVVWEVDVTLATFVGVETSLGQSRAFRVNFADDTDFAFKVRDSPTGNRTNSTEFTADFDLSGSGGFTGLGFSDVGYSESPARGGSNVPAGNIKDIGAAWAAGFQAGGTFSDDYRIFMNLKGTTDPEDFFEITQYSFNPLAEGDDRILEITGGLTDQSVADAFQVANGNTLPNAVQIEVYGENERLQGLIAYAFEGVTFIEQSSSIDDVSGTSVLQLKYTAFQEALAQYDNFGALSDLNVNGGNRMYASDGSVDLALFGGAADSFDAADNPIIVQAAGGSSGFSGSGGSGGAIGNDTPAPANAFLQLAAAIDAADAGDTVDIQNALAVGLGGTSVDKNNLTFNVAAGLNAVLGMSNIAQLNLSGDGSGTVTGSSGENTINGGDGDDVLDGRFGNDTLNGGDGDDTLTDGIVGNSAGADTLNGGGGDDLIKVGFALTGDSYDGGADNDTLDVSLETSAYSNVALNAAGFQEFGANFSNFEHFIGSQAGDTAQGFAAANIISGNAGDDNLSGGGGDDDLDGGAGTDTLSGGTGDDILRDIESDPANPAPDTLNGGADDDTIIISGASTGDSYDGGTETDILDASAEVQAFTGADAADLSGATFNAFGATFANFEHFIGTAFDDEITGGAATTQLEGRAGDDVIVGGIADEIILGGDNDDDITDGVAGNTQGVDQVSGEGGDDIIRVFFGSFGEVYDGGEDTDTIDVSGDTVGHTIDFSGTDAEYSLFGATFRNFENVIGTSAADTITGSDIANEIDGGGGADIINAGDGADILIDDDTNNGDIDTINGQDGDDVFRVSVVGSGAYDGGDGTDTIDLRASIDEYSGSEAINLAAASFGTSGQSFTGFENAFGSDFNDEIIGSDEANVLDGHFGVDDIDGGGGDDIITDQDSGIDTVNGGADNDLIIVHDANGDTYNGGTGFDTLDLSNETQTYSGVTGIILGGAFTGPNGSSFDGFEKLIGTAQADEVTGSGNDDLEVDAGDGDDVVTAASGNDTLTDSDTSGIDTLSGQAGDDTIIVRQANTGETYDGGADNDTLDLSGHLFGFDATNPLDLTGAGAAIFQNFETVLATGESDTIIGSGVGQTIRAGGGLDNVTGGAGDDVIEGGIGGDTLNGGGGANTLSYEGATEGVEVILGSNAVSGGDADGDKISNFVNVTGGSGDDVIFGQNVANVINGGGGDDQLHGIFGSNTVNGGDGDDTLFFFEDEFDRTQTDTWNGGDDGANGDTGDFSGFHSAVTINLGLADEATTRDGVDVNAGTGALRVIAQIENVEHFVGSDFADTLAGGLGVNQLDGGSGNDLLLGRGGDDILNGGAGVDRLNGQLGADTMTGGADSDVYFVDNVGDVVIEEAGGGNSDRVNTVEDFTSGGNIEFVVGKFAPIGLTLMGADGVDRITGANKISFGDDISGEGGNDRLVALVGNDDIDGGGGNDRIFGNSGDDTITGGTGNDRVTGNQGSDTFIHRIGDNNDRITDFDVNADVLDLISHGFSSFAEVMALATDTTSGVRIELAGADSVLLQGVVKAAIGSEDILIV